MFIIPERFEKNAIGLPSGEYLAPASCSVQEAGVCGGFPDWVHQRSKSVKFRA
jgi:hypothetical protein